MKTALSLTLVALSIAWLAATAANPAGQTPWSVVQRKSNGSAAARSSARREMAALAGDPASSGLVTVRVKMPAGYKVPAHWHPTDEHVTVLSGAVSRSAWATSWMRPRRRL